MEALIPDYMAGIGMLKVHDTLGDTWEQKRIKG